MMRQAPLTIRPMAEADIGTVLAIQAGCYTAIAPESAGSLLAKLRASPSTCFIAAGGGEALGYLIGLPWQAQDPPPLNAADCVLPHRPDCLYLHDLAVAAGARALGAGRALVGAFLQRLDESGLARAGLVAIQNSAPYWARYGFRVVAPSARLSAKLASYGDAVHYMERCTPA